MKGVIFNIVEEVVVSKLGPIAWDEMLTVTGLPGVYTSLGSYPDAELFQLVAACADMTATEEPELLHMIGEESIPLLFERYSKFFHDAPNARAFILGLNTIIHPEVQKLYSGAACPHFNFVEAENTISMGYNSPRKLCHLAQGFILGLAKHYDEIIEVHQPTCMHDGAAMCHIKLVWK
ncbi:heme NO-binding domain-containing protein [Sphingorhabdus sp.]|uniref:heme NO-binding domain-containing protein n=1 Tax=Sphingorhabdus sp. TaxID=1902408 RepID=UPI00391BB820